MASTLFSSQRVAGYVGLYSAPLVPALFGAFYNSATGGFVASAGWAALFYPISLVLGSLIGLHIFYFLGPLRLVNWWGALLGGFLTGVLIATVIAFLSTVQFMVILAFGLEGAGAALLFWVFSILGPDPSADYARIWARSFVGRRRSR